MSQSPGVMVEVAISRVAYRQFSLYAYNIIAALRACGRFPFFFFFGPAGVIACIHIAYIHESHGAGFFVLMDTPKYRLLHSRLSSTVDHEGICGESWCVCMYVDNALKAQQEYWPLPRPSS